jgi:gliding motility-associated lipoprotein GldH
MPIQSSFSTLLIGFVFCLFVGCIPSNVYEKNIAIPSTAWDEKFVPEYDFNITDTTANYDIFLTLRHTDAYPYSNIWLQVNSQFPGANKDSVIKIEIPLAEANGKWLGRGMNEIWEHRMPLSASEKPLHFSRSGHCKIKLHQIMRINPLPQIMSVGIRLEKK